MVVSRACPCASVSKRYLVATLVFVGCFSMYALRTALGIALVDMTSEKSVTVDNRTEIISADYNWDSVQKGYILSVYAFGHFFTFVCSPIPVHLGGATTFGLAVLVDALINIATPILLQINLYIFLPASSFQGLLLGAATIGAVDVLTHWSPPEERVRLMSYYVVGCFCGIAFSYPLFGLIARHFGWRAIFYVSGAFASVWSVVWLTLVANDPAQDKYISEEERKYLKEKIQCISTEKVVIPWTKILKSVPIWTLLNEYVAFSWTLSFLNYCIPLFMKDMLEVDIAKIGFLGALPTICAIAMLPVGAYIADYLRTNVFGITKVHKLFICLGDLGSVSMLGLIVLGTNTFWTIICLCLIRAWSSFSMTSQASLVVDMAGQYSSVVKAMTLSASSVGQFLNPIVLGYIVQNHTRLEWNLYFLFLTVVSLLGAIMFSIFGTGKLRSWAVIKKLEDVRGEERTEKI